MTHAWIKDNLHKKVGAKLRTHWLTTLGRVTVKEYNAPYLSLAGEVQHISSHLFRKADGVVGRLLREVHPGVYLVDTEHFKGGFSVGESLDIGIGHADSVIPDDHLLLEDTILQDGGRFVSTVEVSKFAEMFGAALPPQGKLPFGALAKRGDGLALGSHAAFVQEDGDRGYRKFFDKWKDEGIL